MFLELIFSKNFNCFLHICFSTSLVHFCVELRCPREKQILIPHENKLLYSIYRYMSGDLIFCTLRKTWYKNVLNKTFHVFITCPLKKQYFLWFSRKHGLSYSNPFVNDWEQRLIPIQVSVREKCRLLLYIITDRTRSISSMIEVSCIYVLNRKFVKENLIYIYGFVVLNFWNFYIYFLKKYY